MRVLFVFVFACLLVSLPTGCRKFDHISDPDDSTVVKDTVNYSMSFDGTSSYLEAPSTPSLNLCGGDYTIETWAYFNTYTGDWQVLLAKDNMDSNTEWLLTADGPTGRFRFQTRDFSTVLYSKTSVQAQRWYHLAAVQDYENSEVRLYVNGELEATQPLYGRIVSTNNPIRFATRINDITNGYPWYVVDGEMDEVRIWNVARTQTQIGSAMHSTLKGNESGLVAYWNFNEGKGVSAADHSNNGHAAAFHFAPKYKRTSCPVN